MCRFHVRYVFFLFQDKGGRLPKICQISGSNDFPLKYCPNQWLENVPVMEGVIKIWANAQKYVVLLKPVKLRNQRTCLLQLCSRHPRIYCLYHYPSLILILYAYQLQNFAKSFEQVPNRCSYDPIRMYSGPD